MNPEQLHHLTERARRLLEAFRAAEHPSADHPEAKLAYAVGLLEVTLQEAHRAATTHAPIALGEVARAMALRLWALAVDAHEDDRVTICPRGWGKGQHRCICSELPRPAEADMLAHQLLGRLEAANLTPAGCLVARLYALQRDKLLAADDGVARVARLDSARGLAAFTHDIANALVSEMISQSLCTTEECELLNLLDDARIDWPMSDYAELQPLRAAADAACRKATTS